MKLLSGGGKAISHNCRLLSVIAGCSLYGSGERYAVQGYMYRKILKEATKRIVRSGRRTFILLKRDCSTE